MLRKMITQECQIDSIETFIHFDGHYIYMFKLSLRSFRAFPISKALYLEHGEKIWTTLVPVHYIQRTFDLQSQSKVIQYIPDFWLEYVVTSPT